MTGVSASTVPAVPTRDLRLDFFRGLGLLFIFLDHIPDNVVSYLTLGNIVFNDAAELFVFISGYSAALVFGRMIDAHGALFTGVQVLKRCWTLYIAHIFLFVIFLAQVSYTAARFDNPMFVDEMGIADFLQEPHIAILKAVALQFQPQFMDILPLYILLLLVFTVALPLLRNWPTAVLGLSVAVYTAAQALHLNLSTYPEGVWYFNPLAWQLIFFIGAFFALHGDNIGFVTGLRWRRLIWFTGAFLAVTVAVRGTMTVLDLLDRLPPSIVEFVWTIGDKTFLGPLRLFSFLALAHVTLTVFRRDNALFRSPFAEPVVLCGQHSLNIFCVGIFLSVISHQLLVETSGSIFMEVAVSAGGLLVMLLVAYFLAWSKQRRRPSVEPRYTASRQPRTAAQGGE